MEEEDIFEEKQKKKNYQGKKILSQKFHIESGLNELFRETDIKKDMEIPELIEKHDQEPQVLQKALINETDLKQIMKKGNQRRTKALKALNDLMEPDNQYHYPNLNFIGHFSEFFLQNDEILCNIAKQSQPIKIIKDFGKGKVGVAKLIEFKEKPYIIKSVADVDKIEYLSLKVIDVENYKTTYFMEPSLVYNTHQITYDHVNFTDAIFVAKGNNFSNQTCMHLILNEILKDLPNYVYQYDAFYCLHDKKWSGYNIMDVANSGDLSAHIEKIQINGTVLIDLLKQVLTPLSVLKCKRFGFVHADLKCRNVFVSVDDNQTPTYKIADFDKSSIYWKGIRFVTMPSVGIKKHYT